MPTHQVLIASYCKDAEWLKYNLISLKKFSKGFLPPVVAVSAEDYDLFRKIADEHHPEAQIKIWDGTGFIRAQCAMMSGDILCPDADYVFLLGSDCLAFETFTPEPYFDENGLPVMLYNTYEHLLNYHPAVMPWKKGTERALGFDCPIESMRRLPLLYPKSLYKPVRDYIETVHNMPFQDYMYSSEVKFGGNSESNILGSFAYRFMPEIYRWEKLDDEYQKTVDRWPNAVWQLWSHGGLDRPCDQRYSYKGGTVFGITPRQLIREVLG